MDSQRQIQQALPAFLADLDASVRGFHAHFDALERLADDGEARHELLRALLQTAHGLKGAAALFQVYEVGRACHELEDAFFLLLEEEGPPSTTVLDYLRSAVDEIQDAGRKLTAGECPEARKRWLAARAADSAQGDGSEFARFVEACEGLERAVRDLAAGLRKEVDLLIRGGELLVRAAVLHELRLPLLHLVRNAVAHGVELPEVRRKAGKPPRARIWVRAEEAAGLLEVSVDDDGAGLDLKAIRAEAARRNLPVPADDEALLHLVFSLGFSTATRVDQLAGRGVGLDAVRSQVEALGGEVSLATVRGVGTRVSMRIPV